MTTIFELGQEVGIRKNPILGSQTGIIMAIQGDKYHVLCHAIFPHKWIVYICLSEDMFTPSPSLYKSTYDWNYLLSLFNDGIRYKKDENNYHIRENIPK